MRRPTRPLAAFRSLQAFRRDALAFFATMDVYTRGVVEIDFGLRTSFVVADPAVAIAVLGSPAFDKGHEAYGPFGTFAGFGSLRGLVGPSLPVLDGPEGLERRRHLFPVYDRVLASLAAAQSAGRLDFGPVDGTIDLYPVLSRVVFHRFCQTMFGRAYAQWADRVSEAVSIATTCLDALSKNWMPYAGQLGPTSATLRRCREVILAFAAEVHADLIAAGPTPMGLLLGEGLSEEAVRDEIVTQIVAGTETTTITSCWAMVELTRNPSFVAGMRAGGAAGEALAAVVTKETLRMYPAFWTMIRVAREDVEIAGQRFGKGAVLFVSPFCIHHNPRYWPDPWRFDPSRFEGREGVRGDFMPFGFGARSCIGGRLAQAIATECVYEAACQLDLAFVEEEPTGPELDPLIVVLKSRTGFRFRAGRRHRG